MTQAPGLKMSPAEAKRKAWPIFSEYIRVRDSLYSTGTETHLVCCTCGRTVPSFGKNCAQAGHFIPGRHNSVLFDERNVHGQCPQCNMSDGGRWPLYYEYMKTRYGEAVIQQLMAKDKEIRQFKTYELLEMMEEWKAKIQNLRDHARLVIA